MSYSPLYVQVGIDPLYYQLYGPKAEEPLHACFGEPNMAGVLVGYNFASYDNSADNYWVMYARRHGTGYNEVKIRVDLTHKEDTSGGASAVADTEYVGKATDAKLACGLGAVVYRIDLGSGDSSINFNANHVWNYQPSTGFAPLANKEALKSLIDTDVTTPANINVVYFHSGVFATEWSEPATITDYLPNVQIVYFINDNNCSEEKSKWFSSEDEVPVECILNQ